MPELNGTDDARDITHNILLLSPKTVESFCSHLLIKPNISDLPNLVKFAIQHPLAPLN